MRRLRVLTGHEELGVGVVIDEELQAGWGRG